MITKIGDHVNVSDIVSYTGTLSIGHCSILGYGEKKGKILIGADLKIGAFSIIEYCTDIGDRCEIGNYCTIYSGSTIGNEVKILSGSRVYWDAIVGNRAIINGYVSANVVIEDDVRFFGRIAHSHRNHTLDWETTEEKSPIFKRGCFIGLNALIIGAVTIGENSYIAAGEIVRCNIPPDSVFYKDQIFDKRKFRGFII